MATATPPVRPKLTNRTNQKSRNYWTLHMGANNVWATRPKDSKSTIVAFRHIEDAVLIGSMIETHFINSKEWPDMDLFVLPAPRIKELTNIFLQKWEFDDLKLTCTRNMLDMISVENINKTPTSYTFNGNQYMFGAPLEFYQNRFNELLEY
jgi:hypothetical protein